MMNNNNSTYKRLGDYIREVDVRNKDLQCSNLLGLSIAKKFIPSIANMVGTDLRPYKIVKHNQFAYVPVTSRNGEKITVALYTGNEPAIISQAYFVFEIVSTCDTVETVCSPSLQCDQLLPEYLMMWFRRAEFDRYARYHSHGSAREVFDWEEMCNVMLPVPPIEEQRSIVNRYKAIENRIANNKQTIAKLEEAAQALYRKMFVDGIDVENLPEGWRMGCLGEVAEINPTLKVKNELCSFIDMDAISIDKMTTTAKGIREKTGGSKFQNEDVLLARITPCFENGKVGIVVGLKDQEIAIGSTEFIVLRGKELNMPMFLYLICKSNEFRAYGSKHLKGTDGRQRLDWQSVADYPIIIPPFEFMKRLNNSYDILFNFVQKLELENEKLTEMLSMVMA